MNEYRLTSLQWVVETGFECINLDSGKEETEADCDFGAYYTTDSTFVKTADENFNIEYGDGEYLTGIIGTETVTLAGIEVTGQTIALVTEAAWEGDGTTSGLTGLAYAALYAQPPESRGKITDREQHKRIQRHSPRRRHDTSGIQSHHRNND